MIKLVGALWFLIPLLHADGIGNSWVNSGVPQPFSPFNPSGQFIWNDESPFSDPLSDPAFPGGGDAFLYTGNTYFTFNGGRQISIFTSGPNLYDYLSLDIPGDVSDAPEPGPFWLLGAGVTAMLGYAAFRAAKPIPAPDTTQPADPH